MPEGGEPSERVLLRTCRFQVAQVGWRHSDGSHHERAVVRHPGAVTVLPMVDEQKVCLIRNYRIAVAKPLIELPAGTRDLAEQPIDTARRELQEETGYQAARLEPLHTFYLSPGILDEQMFLFLATNLTPGPAARETNEDIENLVTPWDEAMRMVLDGTIEDAKTIVGLLFYDRIRAQLQRQNDD